MMKLNEDVRRQAARAANGLLQRDDLFLDRILADFACETAVTPGVRHGGRRQQLRAAVAGRRHVGLLHEQPHVFVAHAEVPGDLDCRRGYALGVLVGEW